jgi:hypothetical protein
MGRFSDPNPNWKPGPVARATRWWGLMVALGAIIGCILGNGAEPDWSRVVPVVIALWVVCWSIESRRPEA